MEDLVCLLPKAREASEIAIRDFIAFLTISKGVLSQHRQGHSPTKMCEAMMPLILAAEQKEKQARHEEDTNTTVSDVDLMHLTPVTTRASTPISAIPWYDKSYMLIKKGTLKAITLTNDGVRLQDCADGPSPANTWLCVSKNNHIGFLNTDAQVYLGHDGSKEGPSEVHAQAGRMLQFESFITRHHPEGGYQLLSVVNKMLWIVFAASDDKVMRARHGNTLWVFEEV